MQWVCAKPVRHDPRYSARPERPAPPPESAPATMRICRRHDGRFERKFTLRPPLVCELPRRDGAARVILGRSGRRVISRVLPQPEVCRTARFCGGENYELRCRINMPGFLNTLNLVSLPASSARVSLRCRYGVVTVSLRCRYGDRCENPYLPFGFGPRLPGTRACPVFAAMASSHCGEPTGRPMVSAFRNPA